MMARSNNITLNLPLYPLNTSLQTESFFFHCPNTMKMLTPIFALFCTFEKEAYRSINILAQLEVVHLMVNAYFTYTSKQNIAFLLCSIQTKSFFSHFPNTMKMQAPGFALVKSLRKHSDHLVFNAYFIYTANQNITSLSCPMWVFSTE